MDTTNGQDEQGVGVNVDAILAGYADALSGETQRRILAEATVAALTAERAALRERVQSAEDALAANSKSKGTRA